MRLDVYLAEKGLVKSREAAKGIISGGGVTVNGLKAAKPSKEVSDGDDVKIVGDLPKYVGRGGLKLEKALDCFGISVEGLVCMDIGASTGGFTDCMLQNGAEYVYAVDVGHGQLDAKLCADSRVANIEGMNIKDADSEMFDRKIDFISADVSFISLKKVIPVIKMLLDGKGAAVMLIKPQFECGRADIGKNGIVRSAKVHSRVIKEIAAECECSGLGVMEIDFSPIQGGDGNIEYLIYVSADKKGKIIDADGIVKKAHNNL